MEDLCIVLNEIKKDAFTCQICQDIQMVIKLCPNCVKGICRDCLNV